MSSAKQLRFGGWMQVALKNSSGGWARRECVTRWAHTQHANSSFSVGGAAVATEAYAVCARRTERRHGGMSNLILYSKPAQLELLFL
jgi:hypothetical protein